jgi:GDP/UDP-N,N'-diacetylbacillosamine 2-epimerase (hydrolysing)
MGRSAMNIAVLTSSRADYGIYLPLLKKLKIDAFFKLKIIAFGTHLSESHGKTINHIQDDGFEVAYRIETLPCADSPAGISKGIGKTVYAFAEQWGKIKNETDLILCLGDRYEMFAAVSAAIPFNIPIAHLHGGETTLGAIDNAFRNSITCMSKFHFASTQNHANRVADIIGTKNGVYNVGALSLDNMNDIKILNKQEFKEKFNIELREPVLITFHPETIDYEKNEYLINELTAALNIPGKQIIITMPNADTMGNLIRAKLIDFARNKPDVIIFESLGTQGYFSCMKHCAFVLGNSSSGIIEAASFGKHVINLGKRQLGREAGENVINCEINTKKISETMEEVNKFPKPGNKNNYGDGKTADKIISILKSI